jgi:hypothetical protein
MSYIYKGQKGWIKQANRRLQAFRSGLCLIQQEYICRKDLVDYFAFQIGDRLSDEDSLPCIDGAFIYPEPSYQDTGNGFIKITVSAYGRVNTSGSIDTNKRLGNYLSSNYTTINGVFVSNVTSGSQKLFDVAIYRFTIRENEDAIVPTSPTLNISEMDGTILPIGTTQTVSGTTVTFETYLLGRTTESYESKNYGTFNEIIISVVANGSFYRRIDYGSAA